MQSWMFLSSFEKMRQKILKHYYISSLVHMENMVMGIAFGTSATVFRNLTLKSYKGKYNHIKISDIGHDGVPINFPIAGNRNFQYSQDDFCKLPRAIIAYWISENVSKIFPESKTLNDIVLPKKGFSSGDNDRFLRFWFETSNKALSFNIHRRIIKWFPITKGGSYRKWYGNNEWVVNYENDGAEINVFTGSVMRNKSYYYRECISWNDTTSLGKIAFRYQPKGYIPNASGPCVYGRHQELIYILSFVNTVVSEKILQIIAPTMKFEVGQIALLPIIYKKQEITNNLSYKNIKISKIDWDSFETSWDFQKHPFLTYRKNSTTIEEAFHNWSAFAESQFNQLKQNEEELNRIFIDIYSLQDELTPEVEDKDVTISKADRERDIKSFISYAVGCMFGRYSLDREGLIYAGGEFSEKFRLNNGTGEINTGDGWRQSSLQITGDNIIPIADGDYFEDDILERFTEFVRVSFGKETLEENLNYIAETLGLRASETPRQAIRRYFLRDFYKDHVRTYKKRPIYWLFDSGRENGFKALIYMHRYDPYTVARVRTDYLHKLQKKYEAEMNHLDILIDSNVSNREKTAARKRKENIRKQIQECRAYDQAIAHVANQRVELDLDDGVKVNYAKFQGVEIPQGEGKKPLTADLLAKI